MNSLRIFFLLALTVLVCADNTEVANYSFQSPHLLPRQKAPFWSGISVEDGNFVKKSSEEYKGKYLVIIFYPFDFTYVCPTELIAFSENIKKFKEINAEVIGISTDSHFTHLAWTKTPRNQGGVGKLNFPLLADISKRISRSFNILVEDETDALFGASLRGLFILDDKGIIRSFTINDDPVGRSVDETIRLIQAFQHAEKYGDVCPANWKPGNATIIPDQVKKMDYFKNAYNKDEL